MGENNDTGLDKSKLQYLRWKVIHYGHHSHFLEVCLNLQTIRTWLQVKETSHIRTTDNILWKHEKDPKKHRNGVNASVQGKG